MKHLPNDFCRCHDDGCPQHETCLRWVDRNYGRPDHSYPHSPSLFPYDIPLGSPCPMQIKVDERIEP